ncbi:hypothetical protein NCC49_005771 [Naganishia albida]|nr:hypothetical protein NCC49_005771 [Naganishia albida]
MQYPDDDEFENEWDAMDSMQAGAERPSLSTRTSSSKTAAQLKTPSRPSPTGHTIARQRRRSNEATFTKPRWTPYPTPQVQSSDSSATPLRTENEASSQMTVPPSSAGTTSLELDGFEIAPATAVKLNKWRFTPSPEKKAVGVVPDCGNGMIDLTDSPAKGSVGTRRKESVSEMPAMKRKGSDDKYRPDSDVFSSSTPTTSKIGASVVQETSDSDRTVVMDVDSAEGKTEKPEQVVKPVEEETPLSAEQQKVLDMVMAGESLFFTGSAGTGKSFLLKHIINKLRNDVVLHKGRLIKKKVAVTASTGIAGVAIGGVTLHSWAGIAQRKNAATAYKRWNETDVLIIDEISMIDGRFWDKLEQLGRLIRSSNKPFGGIQLVLCGDFFQLPPVPDRHDRTSVFAFQAKTWNKCIPKVFALTQVFRQKAGSFVQMLNEARMGTLSSASARKFAMLARPVTYNDGIEATELYPRKFEAEEANQKRLNALTGTTEMYVSRDVPGHKTEGTMHTYEAAVKLLDQYCKAPSVLELKVGCQVMLITNVKGGESGLFNGSLGKIIGFHREAVQPPSEPPAGEKKPEAKLLPPDQKEAKIAKEVAAFSNTGWDTEEEEEEEPALPPPIVEKPVDMSKGKPIRRWDVDKESKGNLLPLVKFTNGLEVLVKPFEFELLSAKGTLEAKRVQIPLINSWAISIHKSQGMTLPRMKVDLANSFEKGQAYVALSRATSMDTIEVRNFHPSKVFAHPTVMQWSKNLQTVL